MITKSRKAVAGIFAGALALSLGAAPADAVNINTHGSICQAAMGTQRADINVFINQGVVNVNAAARTVTCAVPRSPLGSSATSAQFFVDGDNFNGQQIICILSSYQFDGTLLGSIGFNSSAAHYDQLLTLPLAQVPTFAYVTLGCQLAGNSNSMLRGITAVQP